MSMMFLASQSPSVDLCVSVYLVRLLLGWDLRAFGSVGKIQISWGGILEKSPEDYYSPPES